MLSRHRVLYPPDFSQERIKCLDLGTKKIQATSTEQCDFHFLRTCSKKVQLWLSQNTTVYIVTGQLEIIYQQTSSGIENDSELFMYSSMVRALRNIHTQSTFPINLLFCIVQSFLFVFCVFINFALFFGHCYQMI